MRPPVLGPAPAQITDAIYERSKVIESYRILSETTFDLGALGERQVEGTVVEVVDAGFERVAPPVPPDVLGADR